MREKRDREKKEKVSKYSRTLGEENKVKFCAWGLPFRPDAIWAQIGRRRRPSYQPYGDHGECAGVSSLQNWSPSLQLSANG